MLLSITSSELNSLYFPIFIINKRMNTAFKL